MILGWHFKKITSLVPEVSAIGSFGPWMYKFGKYSFKVLRLLVIGKKGPFENFGEITVSVLVKSENNNNNPWAINLNTTPFILP